MTFIQDHNAKNKKKEKKEKKKNQSQNSNETHNHSRPALPKKNFCNVDHNTMN